MLRVSLPGATAAWAAATNSSGTEVGASQPCLLPELRRESCCVLLGNNCPPAATEAATVRAVASRRGELTSKSSSISVLEAQSCQSLLRARPAAPVGVLCAVGATRRAAGSVSPHRSIGAGSKITAAKRGTSTNSKVWLCCPSLPDGATCGRALCSLGAFAQPVDVVCESSHAGARPGHVVQADEVHAGSVRGGVRGVARERPGRAH
jgi:hypothetical protein